MERGSGQDSTTISLSTALIPGAVAAACRTVCNAANVGGMKIRHLRYRLLNATFDIVGGRFCLRLDLDQVVDDTHPGELTDRALGGVSLRGGLGPSVQYDARVTDLSGDRIGDRSSRAS